MEEFVSKSPDLGDLEVSSSGLVKVKWNELYASAQDGSQFQQLENHIRGFLLCLTCSIMEECVLRSAPLRDLQVYNTGDVSTKSNQLCEDGRQSYVVQQPQTCGFPITLLAVYEPPNEFGNQTDGDEDFNGDKPKLRVYNVRDWVECSRNQSSGIIGANVGGMILYVDPQLGYVYLDLKTGAKIYLPPYDDVEIGSGVMATWTGTPGSTDCITIILDQFSMNTKFIKARQHTEGVGWIRVDLEFKIVDDLPVVDDEDNNVTGVLEGGEDEEQHPLYALIIHGERFPLCLLYLSYNGLSIRSHR